MISQMPLMLYPLMTHLPEEFWHSVTAESETIFLALQSWSVVDEVALDDELEASFASRCGFKTIPIVTRAIRD